MMIHRAGVTQIAPPALANSLVATTSSTTTDATQLVQYGRSRYQAGQFTQAIAAWQQAATTYQAQGDSLNRALVLSYVALAYQQLGDRTKATTAIATSLSIIQNSKFKIQNSKLLLAQALNTQGSLQFSQGQTEAALATWQRAADLYRQAGNEHRRVGSLINQAQAQQALGQFLQARQTLAEVEQTLQQQSNSPLKAIGLRSLGTIRLLMGDADAAYPVLQESLAIAAQLALPQDISATLISLGNAARAQNNPTAALDFYQRAVSTNASPLISTQSQLNQLSLLSNQEQLNQTQRTDAQVLVTAIQTQLEALPASRATVYARINFAQSLMKMVTDGKADEADGLSVSSVAKSAAQTLSVAVQQADQLVDQRAKAYALGYLGSVYERTQQWAEAGRLTEQALLIAQSVNAPEIAYQWQWQLGRILKAQGQRSEATRAYEAAFKTLRSLRSDLIATSPELQFSFRESVEPLYREFVDLLLQSSGTPSVENLKQAREVIESLRLAELDNFFRTACLEGQSVAIDAIAQTDAAVVYPIILADRLEVILSLPGQPLRQYTTVVSQSEVESTLEQWQQNLLKPLTTPEGKRLGQQLYDWLIRPMEADLGERAASQIPQGSLKTLVFVLDGSLRNVPMAALYDGNQYLIERYTVALSPGLRLLNPQPLQQRNLQVLAAGLTEERGGFSALQNVERELNEIRAEVPSRVLLNQAFTSSALRDQINALPAPIVHLATHGQFSSNANETFVLAWDKRIKVNELGTLLRQREEQREEAIELLVLSACETATGDKRAALGLAGVAVQAGARSTLASLWSLDDESGAALISEFYRQLATGKLSKAEALQQAQLSLLRDPTFRHPRYWAPYVLVGNWL
ncbi:MAG: CHAT domain-containing protein [Leptolyngbyaceae cyanobacterium RU_5_1]|nr:CHAT domain-containing protein [Leptolyngbyaceae cyanobacterium RU_5_1]